jgi:hypothetical protein
VGHELVDCTDQMKEILGSWLEIRHSSGAHSQNLLDLVDAVTA